MKRLLFLLTLLSSAAFGQSKFVTADPQGKKYIQTSDLPSDVLKLGTTNSQSATTTINGTGNFQIGPPMSSTLTSFQAIATASSIFSSAGYGFLSDATGVKIFPAGTYSTGAITYRDASGYSVPLNVGSNGTVLQIVSGVPAYGTVNLASSSTVGSSILPVANGGTGTATPALVAGTNVSITGTWPNQTINATGSGGTVTSASVVSANGFAGSVANATTTPAITLSTTISGMLKGNGTAISAATAGTDYLAPSINAPTTIQTFGNTFSGVPSKTDVSGTSNFSVVSGKLRYAPSASSVVTLDAFSSGFKDIEVEARVVINPVTGITSGTNGFRIGLFGSGSTIGNVAGGIRTTTTNPGSAYTFNLDAGGSAVIPSAISGDNLGLTGGETLVIKYRVYVSGTHRVEITNPTNGKVVTYTAVFNSTDNNNGIYPSEYKIFLASDGGGEYDFEYIKVNSYEPTSADLVVIGTSITTRSYASTFGGSWAHRLKNSVNNGIVYGFPAYGTTNILPYIDPLIASLSNKPVIILEIVVNDFGSPSTWLTNMNTIIGKFITAGWTKDKIILMKGTPSSGAQNTGINTINASMDTNFPDYQRVEINAPMAVGGVATTLYFNSDLLHPNQAGHDLMFRIVMSAIASRTDITYKSKATSVLPRGIEATQGDLTNTAFIVGAGNAQVSPSATSSTANGVFWDGFSPEVIRNTTGTNSAIPTLRHHARSSNDMVDGFGVKDVYYIEDNAGGGGNIIGSYGMIRDASDSQGKFVWNTNSTETARMNLGQTGNLAIGIGTTSGSAKLHVRNTGTTFLADDGTTNGMMVGGTGTSMYTLLATGSFNTVTSNTRFEVRAHGLAGATKAVRVANSANSEKFSIDDAGSTLISQAAMTGSAAIPAFKSVAGAHTSLVTTTEYTPFDIDMSSTFTWAAGTTATQRYARFRSPTSATGAFTRATTVSIGGPPTSTGATITTGIGLEVETRSVSNTTNAYGLFVNAPTSATNSYAAAFKGAGTSTGINVQFQNSSGTATATINDAGDISANSISTSGSGSLGSLLVGSTANMGATTVTDLTASGTLSGVFANGSYTPTLTNTTNVAASTAYVTGYFRVGTTVTVFGKIDIDVTTATSTATEIQLTLPIASNLTGEQDLGGTAASDVAAGISARIKGDATTDRASIVFSATSATNDSYSFTFSYQVK